MRVHGNIPKRPVSRGFTLIEILVVVAIIALLISILLPSLAAAREQARVAVCLSRLHALGIAVQSFVAEHKSYYPDATLWFDHVGYKGAVPARFGYAPDYRTPQEGGWYDAPFGPNQRGDLAKYMGSNLAAFLCPADDGYRWWKDYTAAREFMALPPRLSYVMNGDMDELAQKKQVGGCDVWHTDAVFLQGPSRVMMMFEESPLTPMNDSYGEWRGYDGAENDAWSRRPFGGGLLASRHNQRQPKPNTGGTDLNKAIAQGRGKTGSLLFYDTHVETLLAERFNGEPGTARSPANVPPHVKSGQLFDGIYIDKPTGRYKIRQYYRPDSRDPFYNGT